MRYLRWLLYSVVGLILAGSTVFLLFLAARLFGLTIQVGPRKVFASDNIIWLLPPVENSHYSDGDGFVYKGDSVSAYEKNGYLRVNGNYYGKVKIGDSVDISTKGVVLVNGQPREAE